MIVFFLGGEGVIQYLIIPSEHVDKYIRRYGPIIPNFKNIYFNVEIAFLESQSNFCA